MSCWFLSIIFISIVKGENLLGTLFNHTTAERICNNHGNLFSDSIFITNNGFLPFQGKHLNLQSQLPEGQSAWINGHVKYSDFVSWEGCYQTDQRKTDTLYRVPLHDDNFKLYDCISDCVAHYQKEQYLYVSVSSRDCICLLLEDLQNKIIRLKSTNCYQFQPYNSNPLPNTNDSSATVFAVIKKNSYVWDHKHLRLCVEATKRENQLVFSTVLCGSKSTNEIFCHNKTSSDNQLSSWLQANDLCREKTGTSLADPSLLETYIQNLKTNTSYWADLFRVFKVVSESSRSDNVPTGCLAVNHVGDKLVLDPDNCSQSKRVLCSDGLYDHFNVEQTTTFGQENKTDIAFPKHENDGASSIAIYAPIAAVIIVVFFTVSCYIYRRQNQHSIYKQPPHASSSGTEHILTSGEHQQISEYAEVYTSETNNSSTVPSSKIPKKPSRRTCRKSAKQNSAYENFKIKELNDKRNKTRPADEEEYDRVELKGVNGSRRVLEVTYSVGGDARIYSHTLETDSQEDYDTMKSTKSNRPTMDDTYNKVGCTIGNDDTNNQDTCMYVHTFSGTLKSTTVDTNLSLGADED